ncbi:hypothetical protein GCM10022419_102000 [Nonomuraea rosea]|uniref:Uncharacterized protein n=1 Tax=Nonomuraea rosea TaxID=638574 RepID=A0ABP6Z833_9ACTN
MYKHAIAVFTATSAVLMTAAGPGAAEVAPSPAEAAASPAACSNHDVISINVSPPPPLTGTVTATDVRAFVESLVGATPPGQLATPQPSASVLPGTSVLPDVSALPGLAPSGLPDSVPSVTPGLPSFITPTPTPSSAAAAALSPAETLVNEIMSRAIACVNGTPMPASAAPYAPLIDTAGLTRLFEQLLGTPAACGTPSPAATPAPTPTPTSLLAALGVDRVLGALTTGTVACQDPAADPAAVPAPGPADTAPSSRSFLDTLGVTNLLKGIIGS